APSDRHDTGSERHNAPSDRHDTGSERHNAPSDRHDTGSGRHNPSSDGHDPGSGGVHDRAAVAGPGRRGRANVATAAAVAIGGPLDSHAATDPTGHALRVNGVYAAAERRDQPPSSPLALIARSRLEPIETASSPASRVRGAAMVFHRRESGPASS